MKGRRASASVVPHQTGKIQMSLASMLHVLYSRRCGEQRGLLDTFNFELRASTWRHVCSGANQQWRNSSIMTAISTG